VVEPIDPGKPGRSKRHTNPLAMRGTCFAQASGWKLTIAPVARRSCRAMKYSDQTYNILVPFGDWLENLIDPSIKLLNEHAEGELANISFARSTVEAEWEQRTEAP
jgi:hypothetical protein